MIKEKKKVLFSYLQLSNIGCEIIVRGTIQFIEKSFPEFDMQYVVPSYQVERDKALLSDLNSVRVIPMLKRKQLVRGVLRKTGLFDRLWTPRFSSSEFKSADLFVSIGGDIYTIFDGALPYDWIGYERFATKFGIPSMMFGANMDRFDKLGDADRNTMVSHLSKFKQIVVRDKGTVEYLTSYGLEDNVDFHPDPCFLLRKDIQFSKNAIKKVGVNYTPILWREYGQQGLDIFRDVVEGLVEAGYQVNLIPHVYKISGQAGSSDLQAIDQLFACLSPGVKSKVAKLNDLNSFNLVSEAIKETDLFVGGRMHGCLNALTSGKAVCFVGYSKKVLTMVDWLKNSSPFSLVSNRFDCIPADELSLAYLRGFISNCEVGVENPDAAQVEVDMNQYLSSMSAVNSVRNSISL